MNQSSAPNQRVEATPQISPMVVEDSSTEQSSVADTSSVIIQTPPKVHTSSRNSVNVQSQVMPSNAFRFPGSSFDQPLSKNQINNTYEGTSLSTANANKDELMAQVAQLIAQVKYYEDMVKIRDIQIAQGKKEIENLSLRIIASQAFFHNVQDAYKTWLSPTGFDYPTEILDLSADVSNFLRRAKSSIVGNAAVGSNAAVIGNAAQSQAALDSTNDNNNKRKEQPTNINPYRKKK